MPPADPPIIEHLLLENPWPVAITLVLVGLALLWLGNQRQQNKPATAGWITLLLAAGVFITASMVTTRREMLIEKTRTLVGWTAPLQITSIQGVFDPNAVLTGADGAVWLRSPEIEQQLRNAIARHRIDEQHMGTIRAEASRGDRGTVQFSLRTVMASGQQFSTEWRIFWEQQPTGEWLVTEAQWLRFLGQPAPRGLWLR